MYNGKTLKIKVVRRKIALSEKCNRTNLEKCHNKTIGVCFEEQKFNYALELKM